MIGDFQFPIFGSGRERGVIKGRGNKMKIGNRQLAIANHQ